MTRSTFRLPALALALLGTAALAHAQPAMSTDLPLVDFVTNGGGSGFTAPQQVVFKNMADLRAWCARGSIQLPIQPRVDFTSEDVLAVSMGTKPTGGYAIKITKATLMTGGITGGRCFVEVTETTPAPGQPVTMALTSPFHMVRVPKGAIAYHFSTVVPQPGPANALGSLDLTIADGFRGTSEQLVLSRDGSATLYRSSPTARYAPVAGTATAAEMTAVNRAFAGADVTTLPASIPDPRMFIVQPPSMTLTSVVGPRTPSYTGPSRTFTTTANLGYYTPYETRVEPLVAALRTIARRLAGPVFGGVQLTYSGGFVLFSDDIVVAEDGVVTIVRNPVRTTTATQYFNGQATPAELQKIKDAVEAADVPGLPQRIDDPAMVADVPQVTMVAKVSGADFTVVVDKAGFYGQYASRVAPIVDAVRAVRDRIVDNAPQEITGLVSVRFGRTYVGPHEVPTNDTVHRLIYANRGKTITILAKHFVRGGRPLLDVHVVKGKTTANLNLRLGPGTNTGVVRVLPRGTEVHITALNPQGTWFQVGALGLDGWVSGQYVQVGQ